MPLVRFQNCHSVIYYVDRAAHISRGNDIDQDIRWYAFTTGARLGPNSSSDMTPRRFVGRPNATIHCDMAPVLYRLYHNDKRMHIIII